MSKEEVDKAWSILEKKINLMLKMLKLFRLNHPLSKWAQETKDSNDEDDEAMGTYSLTRTTGKVITTARTRY
uniref:Uncharacterized protein n=1 Tax=Panagrolaimus sp. PS1159 TaxID=55785 RepID=A0AC35GRU1_9BILA